MQWNGGWQVRTTFTKQIFKNNIIREKINLKNYSCLISILLCYFVEFEKLELERPEFVGDKRIDPNGMRPGQRPSPITGKPTLYFPSREARKRIYTSLLVVASMIGAVIAAVAFVYFLQVL